MNKNTNLCRCINLKTVMLQNIPIIPGQCYRGVLSLTDGDQYLFEEAVPIDRHGRRNPKLYEGHYISLVHMQNGKYQCHCKTINTAKVINPKELASCVYDELIQAFTIIDQARSSEAVGS